jgi:two-component system, NarL family, response regulator NreC
MLASTKTRRVFLADDHVVLRQGLKAILEQEDFAVVGEAADGHTATRLCSTMQPEIAVLDIGMPMLNGIDAAREIRKTCPNTKIILLTMYADESCVLASLRAGVTGYVLKNNALSDLTQAIEAVSRGETYLSSEVTGMVVKAFFSCDSPPPADPLSDRERQVLQLIAEGKNMKEVGATLGISGKTADTHRSRIMQKLNIFNTAGLVRYALRHHLIEPSSGPEDIHPFQVNCEGPVSKREADGELIATPGSPKAE